jgi:chemotaxis protein CheX
MKLREAFLQGVQEVLSMFGLDYKFDKEAEETFLTSADQVNILISFEQTAKGNIILGMSYDAALVIVAKMSGGSKADLNSFSKSALAELANMIIGSAVGRLSVEDPIQFTPPTLVCGNNLFLLMSRMKATKLHFMLDGHLVTLAYSIE